MTSGCRPIGRLLVGPGIAKTRPGKSGQDQRGGVLPANFHNISGELITLHLGDGTCSNLACFVVAVAKALATNPPAGAHEGAGIVPLGAVPGAFFCEIVLPNLILVHETFGDGCGVLDYAVPVVAVPLPLLPPSPLLVIVRGGHDRGGGPGIFGRGFDEIGGKDHDEGIVHEHLKNFVYANKVVVED